MADGSSFTDYVVVSNETGLGYYVFVISYATIVMLLVAPLVSQSRKYEKDLLDLEEDDSESQEGPHKSAVDDGSRHNTRQETSQNPATREIIKDRGPPTRSLSGASGSRGGFGFLVRELEKVASTQCPDRDPDFQSQLSGSVHPGRSVTSKGDSSLPSAATTSPEDVPSSPENNNV